jgi:hypothetical protein
MHSTDANAVAAAPQKSSFAAMGFSFNSEACLQSPDAARPARSHTHNPQAHSLVRIASATLHGLRALVMVLGEQGGHGAEAVGCVLQVAAPPMPGEHGQPVIAEQLGD